jgi:hypothetical protein
MTAENEDMGVAERSVESRGVRRVCGDDRSLRPDLAGVMLELPAGRWWADDGWLRMEIFQVGDPTQPGLPDGWVWVVGELHLEGRPVDWCTVPVRVDALPPPTVDDSGGGEPRAEVSA